MMGISIKKINNFLLFLFVFTLPLTAFSFLKIGGKDIILSWFLILILGIINLPKSKKISKVIIFLYVWFFVLILTEIKLGISGFLIPTKIFIQLLNMAIMMISLLVLYVILREKTSEEVEKLIKVLFFSTLVFVFYGFYQYFSYFLSFLPKIDIFRNADIYSIYRGLGTEGWFGTHRISSVAPEPSFWASYLLIPLSFCIPYLFSLKKHWSKKLFFIIFFVSLIMTFSRSGFVGIMAIFLIFPFIIKKIPFILKISYFLFFLILIIFILIGINGKYFTVKIFSDLSFSGRLYSQIVALKIFYKNPILGIGFGNFQNFVENYFPPGTNISLMVTHNFFLRILAETGMLGFSAFILFLTFIYKKIVKAKSIISKIGDIRKEKLIQGLELAFFSIIISWFFTPAYNFSYMWFIFALAIVLPKILSKNNGALTAKAKAEKQ